MLAELRMKLEADKQEFGYYQSSNMQGILMQHVSGDYAMKLHEQGLKPYSQHVTGKEHNIWVVKTITEEAYHQIIEPLLKSSFQECFIEKKDMHINILSKDLRVISQKDLLNEFYANKYDRYTELEFVSPTAFKSNGKYIIVPDIGYIFQSLMNKYSYASNELNMYDKDTLEELVSQTDIIKYHLKSTFFPMEGVKIPSFIGNIRIKINGTATLAKYARLLIRFGEYSGVGIKTAMGMGGLKIAERRQRDEG